MTRFLAKITFDCNDGDDVYGLQVITEAEAEMVRRNSHKQISFGSCDWGENEESVGSCIQLQPISEEEYNMLLRLGLDRFGEHFYPGELDSLSDDGEEESYDEDEDEEDEKAFVAIRNEDDKLYSYGKSTTRRNVIQRITPSGEMYFLREKDGGNRDVVHKVLGKSFEKITRKERAIIYGVNEIDLQNIVDELNAKCEIIEFKLV